MTTFDDRLAAQLRALDAAIPEPVSPSTSVAVRPARRFPVRRLLLLAAVLAILGGATTSLLSLHGLFGGDAYQYAWKHATMLGLRQTDQGYTVILEAAYADASQLMLSISAIDTQGRGWSQIEAGNADARFADGSGPAYVMTSGGSAPATLGSSTAAVSTVWFDVAAPPTPGIHRLTVTVPAIWVRDPEPVGLDPTHEVLGAWTFTFDLPIAGGRRVDLATAATADGITATAIGLLAAPTTVKIDLRWSDRGPTATGWSSIGSVFHDAREMPIGSAYTAGDVESLRLLSGTDDASGHWKVVIDEIIGDDLDGNLVRLKGPWVLEFNVAPG